jgi:hypothetical protein
MITDPHFCAAQKEALSPLFYNLLIKLENIISFSWHSVCSTNNNSPGNRQGF